MGNTNTEMGIWKDVNFFQASIATLYFFEWNYKSVKKLLIDYYQRQIRDETWTKHQIFFGKVEVASLSILKIQL